MSKRPEKMIPATDYFVKATKKGERPYEFYVYSLNELKVRTKKYFDAGYDVHVKVYDDKKGYIPFTLSPWTE